MLSNLFTFEICSIFTFIYTHVRAGTHMCTHVHRHVQAYTCNLTQVEKERTDRAKMLVLPDVEGGSCCLNEGQNLQPVDLEQAPLIFLPFTFCVTTLRSASAAAYKTPRLISREA